MLACRHINVITSSKGTQQLDEEELYKTIFSNTRDKTLLVIGMNDHLIINTKNQIIDFIKGRMQINFSIFQNSITVSNKLRIRFVHIYNPEAIYGLQPDYVYII
ncbi:MAG: hypothetical protein M0P69_14005 [Bacteroidales bacterium]|nr:hypothetical protein [Bacteroidales bacterium]